MRTILLLVGCVIVFQLYLARRDKLDEAQARNYRRYFYFQVGAIFFTAFMVYGSFIPFSHAQRERAAKQFVAHVEADAVEQARRMVRGQRDIETIDAFFAAIQQPENRLVDPQFQFITRLGNGRFTSTLASGEAVEFIVWLGWNPFRATYDVSGFQFIAPEERPFADFLLYSSNASGLGYLIFEGLSLLSIFWSIYIIITVTLSYFSERKAKKQLSS